MTTTSPTIATPFVHAGIAFFSLVAFMHHAQAQDCSPASGPKTLCAAPDPKATESAMRAAYEQLKSQISASDEIAALNTLQRTWIKQRDEACATQHPEACLVRLNIERRYFLEGRSVEGLAASASLRPYFTQQPANFKGTEVAATRLKFVNPQTHGERHLNAFMDRQLQTTTDRARDAKPSSGGESYYSHMDAQLNYSSPKLLSASVTGSYFVGQAHPEPWGSSATIDMRTGKALHFRDLLDPANAKKVFAYCHNQINNQKIKSWDDPKKGDITLKDASEQTGDLGRWTFLSRKAVVNYSAYAFGGYGACNCSCDIPYSTLAPLAKKSFPLPYGKKP